MNEPVLLGRKWGFKFAWIEVVIYSAISLALAYRGWLRAPEKPTAEGAADTVR